MTDGSVTMAQARTDFFRRSGFPLDGGYEAKWVKLPVGPITIAFPNTPARRRAVPFHDLHHVLTGYGTNWTGEAEISAWEIASSLREHYIGWVLDLGAMSLGWVIAPRRTFRAFIRGRHSRNLYGRPLDERVYGARLDELREELGLIDAPPGATWRDVFALLGWSAVGIAPMALLAGLVAAIAIHT